MEWLKNLKTVDLAVLALIMTAAYYAYSSQQLSTASIQGQDPKLNADIVEIDTVYQDSCDVTFRSRYGEATYRYDPCKFSFEPDYYDPPSGGGTGYYEGPNGKFLLDINSASRGRLQSLVGVRGHVSVVGCDQQAAVLYQHRSDFGMEVFDASGDSLDWVIHYNLLGGAKSIDIKDDWGCFKLNPCIESCYCPSPDKCVYSVDQRLSGGGWARYEGITTKTLMRDKSNTFELEISGRQVTFQILKAEYYEQERYHRSLIHSYPHLRTADCPIKPGYMLSHQIFHTGETINIDNFDSPVNYFCSRNPAIILDANNETLRRDGDIYQRILDGESVVVPIGEVWELFYIFKATGIIDQPCVIQYVDPNPDGLCADDTTPVIVEGYETPKCMILPVYDPDTGDCLSRPGIVFTCTKGTFDYQSMTCVVQPENPCPIGYVLDESAYPPTCIHHPIKFVDCEEGTLWDEALGGCYYEKEKQADCSFRENATYSAQMDVCSYPRPLDPLCDSREGEYLEYIET